MCDSRAVLLGVLDLLPSASCDCPKQHNYHCHGYCPQSMLLLISARQLSAELLLLSDGMATEAPPISKSETMWAPTPAELCHVAMATIWKMFSETGTHLTSMTSHVAWAGLLALLRVIKWTCRLYLVRGSLDKAYSYIREAAMLTKKLQLTSWCVKCGRREGQEGV